LRVSELVERLFTMAVAGTPLFSMLDGITEIFTTTRRSESLTGEIIFFVSK
jgi:hypothetical protein